MKAGRSPSAPPVRTWNEMQELRKVAVTQLSDLGASIAGSHQRKERNALLTRTSQSEVDA